MPALSACRLNSYVAVVVVVVAAAAAAAASLLAVAAGMSIHSRVCMHVLVRVACVCVKVCMYACNNIMYNDNV